MSEKKCPHNGVSEVRETVDFEHDEEGNMTRQRTRTVRGWTPAKCLGEECAAWRYGACHYGVLD